VINDDAVSSGVQVYKLLETISAVMYVVLFFAMMQVEFLKTEL
jgi:hypothetical protein